MPVRKRLKIKGPALLFVTTTVTNWTPVFRDEVAANIILAQLHETIHYFGVSLVGYVLMPSHLHALLGFPRVEQLSKFMQSFKSLTARRVKQIDLGNLRNELYVNGRFRLWRPRFDDLVMRTSAAHESPSGLSPGACGEITCRSGSRNTAGDRECPLRGVQRCRHASAPGMRGKSIPPQPAPTPTGTGGTTRVIVYCVWSFSMSWHLPMS